MQADATTFPFTSDMTIRSILETGVRKAPQQTIQYANQTKYTYLEFQGRVAQLANLLVRAGVKSQDRVGVMDWDSHRYLETFFAVPMMGATLHTINVRLNPEQLLYTINHAEDSVILIHSDFIPLFEAIKDRIETAHTFIFIADDETSQMPDGEGWIGEYEQMMQQESDTFTWPDLSGESRATLFYTSGTTGDPKGVYFSHQQLVVHTFAGVLTRPNMGHGSMHSDDVYMPLTPMFHVHAWGVPYIAMMLGIKQIYPGRYVPEQLLELIKTEKVTLTHCVPTILQMLFNHPTADAVNFTGLKMIIGGSALPPALADRALKLGIDITSGYGMSETCPLLTQAILSKELQQESYETQLYYRCSAGQPASMAEIQIWNEKGEPQPHDGDSQGEVVARAPWLTPGYYKQPEKTKELWEGGWLHTGDIGVIDERGYLFITDRIKDVIKTGGEWVSSIDIEASLLTHPAVAEAAVIGAADEKWGERPVGIVVARPGAKVDEAALKTHVQEDVDKGSLSKYSIPDRVIFVEELPKTSVGKLNKKVMRDQLLAMQ